MTPKIIWSRKRAEMVMYHFLSEIPSSLKWILLDLFIFYIIFNFAYFLQLRSHEDQYIEAFKAYYFVLQLRALLIF